MNERTHGELRHGYRKDLGAAGSEMFVRELHRFPGVRKLLLDVGVASTFIFFPERLSCKTALDLDALDIADLLSRYTEQIVEEVKAASYRFITSYLASGETKQLLVQSDYHRLQYRDQNGFLRLGSGEEILIVKDPGLYGIDLPGTEIWTVLFGSKMVSADDVELTKNRGMLNPRPLGLMRDHPIPRRRDNMHYLTADEAISGAEYLFFDAFDGAWLIFAELSRGQ
jgi:hypothetical protein